MHADLLHRVYSRNPQIVHAALAELKSTYRDHYIEALIRLLIKASSPRQLPVLVKQQEYEKQLAQLLQYGDASDEVMYATQLLRRMQKQWRKQHEVIQDLRREIVHLGRPAWSAMMELAKDDPRTFVEHINSLMLDFENVVTFEDILASTQHEQVRIRQRAGYMLAKFDDPRVVPALVGVIRNGGNEDEGDSMRNREAAARALAQHGQSGIHALLNLYQHATALRDAAAIGLMQAGDARALDIALEWMLLPDATKRLTGLSGLGKMLEALPEVKLPRVLDALTERIAQGNENSYSSASKLVALLGKPAIEPMLQLAGDMAAEGGKSLGRVYALDALWQIYQADPMVLDTRFTDLLQQLVGDSTNPQLAQFAAQILVQLPIEQGLETLVKALDMHCQNAKGLMSILYAIGQLDDVRALPALKNLFNYWQMQEPSIEVSELLNEISDIAERIEQKQIEERYILEEQSISIPSEHRVPSEV
jgi:HEAT repeat protein